MDLPHIKPTVLARHVGFAEGPVFLQDGAFAFVQIDAGRVCVWETEQSPHTIAHVGGGPNGAVEMANGQLLIAQNGGAYPALDQGPVSGGIQTLTRGGEVSWLTKEPVSPNDLAIGPDGYLYATDPTRKPERDEGRIWRIDIQSGDAQIIARVDWYPNGIGFSLRDDVLYVADTRRRRVVKFDLHDGKLSGERTWIETPPTRPDGFAFDQNGNCIIAGVGLDECNSDIQVWSPSGQRIHIAQAPTRSHSLTNVAIDHTGKMVVTDSANGLLLEASWPIPGLALHPFRPGVPASNPARVRSSKKGS